MESKSNCILLIQELNCIINEKRILKGINMSVQEGEFVGLIGPNGAGKTTLLKCINGIICNNSGEILIEDRSLKSFGDRDIARKVSLMHQNTTISFPLSSMDIVLMGRYPHLKRSQRESKKDYSIARGNMEYTGTLQFEDKPITQLSGGERQGVLFAKVLTQETDIILLDEPTASLDISHQEQIFRYSRELADSGRTVIAAVHDLKIASRYCSRLVLMKDGGIIANGPPEEVLTRENISNAYGVNAIVYKNKITGLLDFHIYKNERSRNKGRVHVIGGGGSASWVIRKLFEEGYSISAGVFAPEDSDRQSADVFGVNCVVCKPYSGICEDSFSANLEMIGRSDLTILCNMPFGWQNLRNLEAAAHAEKLVIIEDDPPDTRDFTGGKAMELYNDIVKNAIVTSSARLHEVI